MSKNFNTTMTVKIPADGSPVHRDATFSYFMVRTAAADFEMSFDGQSWFPMAQGEAIGPFVPAESKFWLRALNGVGQDVEVRCSSVANANNRLNIIHDANQFLIVNGRVAPTYLKCGNANIDPGDTLNIPGVDAGNLRKDILIFNLDGANNLFVQAGAVIGGVIYAQDNLPLETSDVVTIKNTNAAAVPVAWIEIYYAPIA